MILGMGGCMTFHMVRVKFFFNQLVCWCGNVIFSYDRQEVLISWVAASTVSYIYKDTTLSSKRENTTNWMWWKYKFFAKFMIILKSCVIHFFWKCVKSFKWPVISFLWKMCNISLISIFKSAVDRRPISGGTVKLINSR